MLTCRVRLSLLAAAVVAIASITVAPDAMADPACGRLDRDTGEYIACASSESETGGGEHSAPISQISTPGDRVDPCHIVDIDPQPTPDSPIWDEYLPPGADPSDYVLRIEGCGPDGRGTSIIAQRSGPQAPPDPAVVAAEAVARLPIPLPHIRLGPDADQIAVNVPVWLWISNPDPVSASATDRTVTVTATAALTSVTWSMGETGAVDFTCTGAGVAPRRGVDLWDPPCGYTYRLRSLTERTGGSGAWGVTAEATWAISWIANTGASGTDSVTTRSMAPARVGEWRTVIVADN